MPLVGLVYVDEIPLLQSFWRGLGLHRRTFVLQLMAYDSEKMKFCVKVILPKTID